MASGLQGHLSRITEGLKDLSDDETTTPPPAGASPAKKAMPATSSLAHFSDELAALRETAGQPMRVRMDLCDEGSHHTTPVDPERVARLKPNLKANGQSSPAILRRKPDGRFEIIAGRHRKSALLELGEEEWDAVIKDLTDDQAERLTFYDNLYAPNLTDYERFMGFARRKQTKGYTDQQLADEAGVSRPTIVRLMSFQQLPERALAAVAAMPTKFSTLVTGNFIIDLVKLVATSGDRVSEALEQVGAGTLAVADVMKWVQNTSSAKPAAARSEPHTIRAGKATFAKVSRREGRVVVDFADKTAAAPLEKAIIALIEEHAQKTPAPAQKTKSGVKRG